MLTQAGNTHNPRSKQPVARQALLSFEFPPRDAST